MDPHTINLPPSPPSTPPFSFLLLPPSPSPLSSLPLFPTRLLDSSLVSLPPSLSFPLDTSPSLPCSLLLLPLPFLLPPTLPFLFPLALLYHSLFRFPQVLTVSLFHSSPSSYAFSNKNL